MEQIGISIDPGKLQQAQFWVPPPPAGYWLLDKGTPEIRLYRTERPAWLHRTMVALCFGLRWVDERRFTVTAA